MADPARAHEAIGLRVRPRRSLLRNGLLASFAGGIPLFAVLHWLAYTQGNWAGVVVVEGVYLLFVAIGVWRWNTGFIEVTPTTITKQAFAKRTIVKRADVASILIAQTYHGGTETMPQFVAIGADAAVLFRMRGTYWSVEDMRSVARSIDAPVTEDPDPLTMREFYDLVPGSAYWYEGRPWVVIAGIVAAFVVSSVVISWLMAVLGVTGVLHLAG